MDKKTETLKLALKLALEAQERAWLWMENQADGQSKGGHATFDLMMLREERDALRDSITAIREALAEQCVCGEPDTPGTHRTDGPCLAEQPAQQWTDETAKVPDHVWVTPKLRPLAKTAHEQQEPVIDKSAAIRIATALGWAPSKPWVGLTDEERDAILDREFKQWWSRHDAVCRAIEAKLREKNHG